jgi:hypothetical protein
MEQSNQSIIVTYAVLVGLTPLIPIPIVDDMIKVYFQRSLIRRLAKTHDVELSKEDVIALTSDKGGCLPSCLGTLFIYPIKKLSRKILYFLEIKRMVDLTSLTFHQGYLINYVLEHRLMKPVGDQSATNVRLAIDETCSKSHLKPVEKIIYAVYKQSTHILLAGSKIIEKAFKGLTKIPSEEQVEELAREIEPIEKDEIAGVAARIQKGIGNVSEEHFVKLKERFNAQIEQLV